MTIFEANRLLLDAFRRGDRAALTSVYWHYLKEVDSLMRRGFFIDDKRTSVPGARDLVEHKELVQEVFLRAFSESARLAYNALHHYRPYLMRIAKNLLVDRARRKQRHVLGAEHDVAADEAVRSDAPVSLGQELDADPQWRSAAEATKAFIAALPDGDRTFVQRRFIEQRAQSEVGDLLGLSRKQVRRAEDRIRAALRAHLVGLGLAEAP